MTDKKQKTIANNTTAKVIEFPGKGKGKRKAKQTVSGVEVKVERVEIWEPEGEETSEVTNEAENAAIQPENEQIERIMANSLDGKFKILQKGSEYFIVNENRDPVSIPFEDYNEALRNFREFTDIRAAEVERRENEPEVEPEMYDASYTPTREDRTITTREQVFITSFNINGNGKQLAAELALLRATFKTKNTIPVLNMVHVTATGNKLQLAATDLDNWITCDILGVSVGVEGSFLTDLAEFTEAVKRAGFNFEVNVSGVLVSRKVEGEPEFDNDEMTQTRVSFNTGKAAFEIEGADARLFPEPPSFADKTPVVVSIAKAEIVSEAIAKVIHAATKESSRFTLGAVSFEFDKDENLRLVSTDGHRLAVAEMPGFRKLKKTPQALINMDGAKALARFAEKTVSFTVYGKEFVEMKTRFGSRRIVARQSSGNFPNYEMVIPKAPKYSFGIQPDAVLPVLQSAVPFVNEKGAIAFQPYYNNLVLKTLEGSDKSFASRAACSFPGNGAPGAAVNVHYFMDAIKAGSGAGVLRFDYTDFTSQFLLSGSNGSIDYRFVIMPLNLNADRQTDKHDPAEYYILNDAEKETFKTVQPFQLAPVAKPEAVEQSEDCYPLPESSLDRCLSEIGFLQAIIAELPEKKRADFSKHLSAIQTELDNCQY